MLDKTAILKEAQKYLAKGAVDKAISELEKLVNDSPDGNTYNMIGDIYLRKGAQKSAVEYYKKSALFFWHEGFSQKAQALYKKVLNINPADTDALLAFGEICEEKSMLAEAIKYYLVVADLLAKEGKKEKILDVYAKILSLSPANIPLRVKVADIYIKEGLKSDAAREFMHIARIHEEKGDMQKAREFFQKTLDVQPLNKDATLGLSCIFEKNGELQLAFDQMKDAVVLFPEDLEILFRCTDIAIICDDTGFAKKCLQRIEDKEPQNIKARRMLGELYLKAGETELAWAQFLPILDQVILDQKFEDAISFLNIFRSAQPIETGKRLVSLYKQLNEDDRAIMELIAIGDLLAEKGNEEDAKAYYAEAEEIDPSHAEVRKRFAPPEPEPPGPVPTIPEIEIFEPEIETETSPLPENSIFTQPGQIAETDELELPPPLFTTSSEAVMEEFKAAEDKKETVPERIIVRAEKAFDEVITEADIFSRYGLLSEAQRLLEGLRLRFPDNIDLHLRLKSMYADTHDTEAAVTECIILSKLYKRNGDAENAEQALKDAFAISPEDPRLAEQGFSPLTPSGAQVRQTSDTAPQPTGFNEHVVSGELDIDDYEEEIAEADFYSRQGLGTEAIKILEKLQMLFPGNRNINERLQAMGQAVPDLEAGDLSGSMDLHNVFDSSETVEKPEEFGLHGISGADEESAVPDRIEQQKAFEVLATDESLPHSGGFAEEKRRPDKHEMFDLVEETEVTAPLYEKLPPAEESAPKAGKPSEESEFESFNLSDDDLIDAQEMPEPALDSDVFEIFQEFKRGLEKELGDEDSETHYNLGIAYKEMGLVDDAIKEFQTSRADPARFIQSSTMLGVCYMEKGLYSLAIDVLNKAIQGMKEQDDSYWALTYELAEAYEKNHNLKEALDLYTGVYGWSAVFRNVSDKMSQLRAQATLIVEQEKEQAKEKPKERKDRVSYL